MEVQDQATVALDEGISLEELQLAARNHGMPLEMLAHDVTPIGMHYLLTHFDIPVIDVATWRLNVGGLVERPLTLDLADVTSRPSRTLAVTLECAGNGRARLQPRPQSQPWLHEAVGTAEWTGTPLWPVLQEAGVTDDAMELVFTGADRGIQGDLEHHYERSLTLAEAQREEVMLVWAINRQPLPPQHGYPLRLVVPGWYGMTSVKWLTDITAIAEPFAGYQQAVAYHVAVDEDEVGTPVTRIAPRSLMVPPGVPEFFTRRRHLTTGACIIRGRAWSGRAPIVRVEVSTDGGASWSDAELGTPVGEHAWTGWTYSWTPDVPGDHVLMSRATDGDGNTQPLDGPWNRAGVCNNSVQRVIVTVAG